MKCHPLRWLWGLIPLAILSWLATVSVKPGIERDLTERVRAQLGEDLGWATLAFDGRDLLIGGKAAEEGEPTKAAVVADAVRGVRLVDVKADLLRREQPFTWTAAIEGEKLVLQGFVPSQRVRKAVVAAARGALPKAEIDDRMELARGNPAIADWQAAVGFGLKKLALLKPGSGRVGLSDLDLAVSGEALNTAAFKDLRAAVGSGVKGVKIDASKVTPPTVKPYTWVAKLSGNQVVMTGYVPSDEARSAIVVAARKAFGQTPIVDKMEPGAGDPKDWPKVAVAMVDLLATLKEGAAELDGNKLTLSGLAEDDGAAKVTEAAFKKLNPAGYQSVVVVKGLRPALPLIEPYQTSVDATATGVVVSGYVPSDAARDAVIKAVRAKIPGRQVTDQLKLGVGQPDGFDTCLLAGVDGLQRLGLGRVALVGKAVELTGVTEDETLAMALPAAVREAARGTCETRVKVTYDDTRKRQAAEAEAARVKAEADAAERARRDADAAAAKAAADRAAADRGTAEKAAADKVVTDKATAAPDRSAAEKAAADKAAKAKADFEAAKAKADADAVAKAKADAAKVKAEADAAAAAAKSKAEAEARAKADAAAANAKADAEANAQAEARAKAEAEAKAKADAELAASRAKALAESKARAEAEAAAKAKALATMTPAERKAQEAAAACQQKLESTAKGQIQFERASDALLRESNPVLQRLVDVAKTCRNVTIDIEGHTDDEGEPERNNPLSVRRAEAVRDFLVKSGIPGDRIKAVGFGETRPRWDNNSADGRALNRRIEFTVKAN